MLSSSVSCVVTSAHFRIRKKADAASNNVTLSSCFIFRIKIIQIEVRR